MNKKILIPIIIFFLLIVGLGLFILLRKSNNQPPAVITPGTEDKNYSIQLIQNNKELRGTVTKDGKIISLTEENLKTYALMSYNTPQDILWTECAEGYTMTLADSPSNNPLSFDQELGAVSMELLPDQNNILDIICSPK